MLKKFLFISLLLIIKNYEVLGQYSSFKHQGNDKSESKKEVKKTTDIKSKTKDCDVYNGLFKIYQSKKDGKSYIEIDTSHLGNEFIYFSYIENGVIDAWAVKGKYRGSKILQIKDVSKNEYIGYNQTYKTYKKIKIAIIGIGYADGISRLLSNNGKLYYKDFSYNIIGRISMDSITIDISKSSQKIKTGDYMYLINKDNNIEKVTIKWQQN